MFSSSFFQWGPIPLTAIQGTYTWYLVLLSYIMASLASYVALDLTERIRTPNQIVGSKLGWLIGGALAMGMGIWTMHFIGMLAFVMPMPMEYDPFLTGLSMLFAIIASGFAFFLIKNEVVKLIPLMLGGVLLGFGIATMHYIGMSAMRGVKIHYIPSLFALSIVIAVVTSEAALCLMIFSSRARKYQGVLKIGSALIMGLAVCGMHYTGMAAAVFIDDMPLMGIEFQQSINPDILSFFIGAATILIMSIAVVASRFWMYTLQNKNQKLLETEAILQQKSLELEKLNQNLISLAEQSIAKEEKITAILTAAGDGIMVLNGVGEIAICNRAALKILHYSVENEVVSQNISSFIGHVDSSDKEVYPISLPLLLAKSDLLVELVGFCKDKNNVPVELSVSKSLIKDDIFYIIVFRDISERKRAEEELNALNQKFVLASRQAGMAEVATCVLHNVGNVLNSINVSAQVLLNRSVNSQIYGLAKMAQSLEDHKNELDKFLKTDEIGRALPQYLNQFVEYLKEEQNILHRELESLTHKIQHIKDIVLMQQMISGYSRKAEKVQIHTLLEDALAINAIEKSGIIVEREFEKIPPFDVDKVKIFQIIINLIKNAKESLLESTAKEKKIVLRIKLKNPDHIVIEVSDNGLGIKEEDITRIFSYGYTTKKKGHGYGLHPSALSAQEAGGSLTAHSRGLGHGATFVLTLPKIYKKDKEFKDSHEHIC